MATDAGVDVAEGESLFAAVGLFLSSDASGLLVISPPSSLGARSLG